MYYLLLLSSNEYDRYGIVLSHFFNEFNYSEQPKIIINLFIITLVEAYMSHFDAYSILTVS